MCRYFTEFENAEIIGLKAQVKAGAIDIEAFRAIAHRRVDEWIDSYRQHTELAVAPETSENGEESVQQVA